MKGLKRPIENEEHMAEEVSASNEPNNLHSRKKMKKEPTTLDSFTQITSNNPAERIRGGITIIKHLARQNNIEEFNEVKHSLRRLIRGLGSAKDSSRMGFYSTLTTYLHLNPNTKVSDLLALIDAELKQSKSNSKGENADISLGQILVSGALIRSKLLINSSTEEKNKVIEMLIKAGYERTYLTCIAVSFLVKFIEQMDENSLKSTIWPLIKKELSKDWSGFSLDTFYLLLYINEKFPSLVKKKFLRKHLNTESLVCRETLDSLEKLLTDTPRIEYFKHPVYKIFCELLVTTDLVEDFWMKIEARFVDGKPSRSMVYLSLELLNLILMNIKDKSVLPSLLSDNFFHFMLKRFTITKQNRNDDVANMFKKCLTQLTIALNDDSLSHKIHIQVINKLLMYPDYIVEKLTGIKVIQMITANLGTNEVEKLSKFYNKVIENTEVKRVVKEKPEFWTNAERLYITQMLSKLLGHPAVISEHKWRVQQLKFLFYHGFTKIQNVSVELASSLKESFYNALDHNLQKLNDLKTVLKNLVFQLNDELFVDKTVELRKQLNETGIEAWKNMIDFIKKSDDNENQDAVLIFSIMDLQMGLQLFSYIEMAVSSINEIHSCSLRLNKTNKSKKRKSIDTKMNGSDEPIWIEVIVDLLLSFLSKNNHLLRTLVKSVFPRICSFLTAGAIHQILEVLEPKEVKGSSGNDSSDELESDDEEGEVGENSDGENDEESDDSDSDDGNDFISENENDDDNDDETLTDQLRLAVRQALGDASAQTDDEDVDIDEITEEDGKRMDASLAAAFKILREKRQQIKKKKQGKSAEALTHFRLRVIDLIEIYINSKPSMALVLDILIPLFALLEFCIKDHHQKPLENRVRFCLKKLFGIKEFKDCKGVDEKLLTDIAKVLMEKGERPIAICHEIGDKLTEFCIFLIRCVQQAELSSEFLENIYCENLKNFFIKRDCILPPTLFQTILMFNWDGNWKLASTLMDFPFNKTIRSFRRNQALEFFTAFYRNQRLMSVEKYKKQRKQLEKKLFQNINKFFEDLISQKKSSGESPESSPSNGEDGFVEVREKFLVSLWDLLTIIFNNHLPECWNWQKIKNYLIEYKKTNNSVLSSGGKSKLRKLAIKIGVPMEEFNQLNGVHVKSEKEEKEKKEENEDKDDVKVVAEVNGEKEDKKVEKRKKKFKSNANKKLKKEARELRAKTMAEGFKDFNFSKYTSVNGINKSF